MRVVGQTTPVGGAVISLLGDVVPGGQSLRPRLQFISDGSGNFEASSIPLGHYAWETAANGFAPARGEVSFGADGNASLIIEIAKLGSISGAVLSPAGKPIPGAVVSALPPWKSEIGTTTVDANGNFRLDGLMPGRYLVVAHPTGSRVGSSGEAKGQGWLTTFFPSGGTREGAQAVTVASGQDLTGYEIRVHEEPTMPVAGQVFAADGRALPNTTVRLRPDDPGQKLSLTVASDLEGKFRFAPIPAGRWNVGVDISAGGVRYRGESVVTVADHPVTDVQVKLQGPFTVTGQIRYAVAGGGSALYLMSRGIEGAAEEHGAIRKADGSFVILNVHPGRYRIVPVGRPAGQYLASIRLGGADVAGQEVELSGGALPITVEYRSNGGRVIGTVRDGAGALVALLPREESLRDSVFIYQTSAGSQGRFEVAGVRPGEYYAFAFRNGDTGAFEDPAFVQQLLPQGTSIRVAEGESANLDLNVGKWPW